MLALAILATLASLVWTAIVVLANGMSDAPTMAFQGGWSLLICWGVTAGLYVAWWFG